MVVTKSKLVRDWLRWSVLVTDKLFGVHWAHCHGNRFYIFEELLAFVLLLENDVDRWSVQVFELELDIFMWN